MLLFEQKIVSLDEARQKAARPLVFTNGVFDILHRGHVTYLAQARQLGASLAVGVNSDESVRRLGKGPDRPINRTEDRAALLAALGVVDYVIVFEEDTPYELLEVLRPDVLVKGGDYDMERLRETQLVRSWGGRALSIAFAFERSTTETLARIRASGANDAGAAR